MDGNDAGGQRYRRPPLPRTQPIRSWTTLFGPPAEAAPRSPQVPEPPANAVGGARAERALAADPAREGVRAAYRVIEAYIGSGRETARRVTGAEPAREAAEQDAAARNERIARYASDLAAVGLELVQNLALGPAATAVEQGASEGPFSSHDPAPAAAHEAAPPSRAEAPGGAQSGAFELRAAGRALRVRWDLSAAAAGARLRVEMLTAPAQAARTLVATVQWPARGQAPCVSVDLAGDEPAGIYRGVVADADGGAPVGTLEVHVVDARPGP